MTPSGSLGASHHLQAGSVIKSDIWNIYLIRNLAESGSMEVIPLLSEGYENLSVKSLSLSTNLGDILCSGAPLHFKSRQGAIAPKVL